MDRWSVGQQRWVPKFFLVAFPACPSVEGPVEMETGKKRPESGGNTRIDFLLETVIRNPWQCPGSRDPLWKLEHIGF